MAHVRIVLRRAAHRRHHAAAPVAQPGPESAAATKRDALDKLADALRAISHEPVIGVSVDLGAGRSEGKDVALRAVVVGGGIGGIAAAVALARAGIDVQVYEQAQQLTEVGAGVSLAPNGLRMLERLGVGEGIGRVGARYVSAQLRFSDGRAVSHEPDQFTRPGQNVGILRAEL